MINFAEVVAAPAPNAVNTGLSPCGTARMLWRLGIPGKPARECSPVTNQKLKRLLITQDVGPFNVTGLKPAVESLTRIFARVQQDKPDLHAAIKTAGMTCCRLIRGSKLTYSIHSFGCAVDLYCGTGVVPLGTRGWHKGVALLYPYFHNEGWYAGVEFSRCDGMHFECSRELVDKWARAGLL